MTNYDQSYKQLKRQRQQKQKNLIIASLLALTFAGSLYSAISTTMLSSKIDQATQLIENAPAPVYTYIRDISLNSPDNFRIAHQATVQACQKHGLATTTPDGLHISDCVADLLAMVATETGASFNFHAIGDNGHSIGLFQICDTYHPNITTAQRQDPFFSADWTIARMINNHYKTNRDYAVRKHNGGINWKTAQYLAKVNYYKNMLLAI